MKNLPITPPLSDEMVRTLTAGQQVLLTGTIYTARDAAHKKLIDLIDRGKQLPIDLTGQILYFTGPTPAKPGVPVGSAGPTTSYRMDSYSPRLISQAGLKGMIGKGDRGSNVIDAMKRYGAVYFAAIGGVGALIAQCIRRVDIVAYPELGPEAIHRFDVVEFPLIVAIGARGDNLYRLGPEQFRKQTGT
ncbi:MAG: Fe-S-containing hydro-lyase [Chitinispirillaceae bacterium]